MRIQQYKYIIPGFLAMAVVSYACSHSFLEKSPAGALQAGQLANKAGVNSLLIGAYAMLDGEGTATQGNQYGSGASNWVFGSVVADDSYKGSTGPDQNAITPLQTWVVSTAANSYIEQKWTALYDGAQRTTDSWRGKPGSSVVSSISRQRRSGRIFPTSTRPSAMPATM